MAHRVVIVGGGFGGLNLARKLRRANVEITLIDRQNYHLFQPLLYQVATGGLSPANISSPLRAILKRQKNIRVLMGEVVGVDTDARRIRLAESSGPHGTDRDGETVPDEGLPYDTLVLATGSRPHYFGNEQFQRLAPGLKGIEDATEIRGRILRAFEAAERWTGDPEDVQPLLTFLVVGGGPTGLELSGTIAELARQTLVGEFRRIDTRRARVILAEGESRLLPNYPESLSVKAQQQLEQIGVTVMTGAMLDQLTASEATLRCGDDSETIPTANVFWAAGVQASPLGKALADTCDAELDKMGRVVVAPDCSVPACPDVLVIGDLACFEQDGKPLPGVAPVAIQQAKHAARQIRRRVADKPTEPFRYKDRGQMATIGRAAAVCDLPWLRFSGLPAWLAWLLLHLLLLVGFQNRLLVLMQWCWNYVTRNRSARLITGEGVQPPLERAGAEQPEAEAEAEAGSSS